MLKKIALSLLVLVVVLSAVVATRPDGYRVERSAVIAAPPAVVFALVEDFHKWAGWSPWEKLDPDMQRSFAGPRAGVGATYAWAGNDKVGEGRMTIAESVPAQRIGITLQFLKPWESTSDTLFTFAPDGAGTRVSWAMQGRHNFMSKAFSLFASMDSMVGPDFEKGLAALRSLAEAEAQKPPTEALAEEPATEAEARKPATESAQAKPVS